MFVGPTLAADEVRARCPTRIVRPPAGGRRHPRARARARGSARIAIIDGYFERMAAVWHKEILLALERGIAVWGAASMGALRAAELAPFGMRRRRRDLSRVRARRARRRRRGRGRAPAGGAGLPRGLRRARQPPRSGSRARRVIARDARALVELARARFYRERSWARLVDDARAAGLPTRSSRRWLRTPPPDRKATDARALLARLARDSHPCARGDPRAADVGAAPADRDPVIPSARMTAATAPLFGAGRFEVRGTLGAGGARHRVSRSIDSCSARSRSSCCARRRAATCIGSSASSARSPTSSIRTWSRCTSSTPPTATGSSRWSSSRACRSSTGCGRRASEAARTRTRQDILAMRTVDEVAPARRARPARRRAARAARPASCTAISSRRTCWSRRRAGSCCSTSGSSRASPRTTPSGSRSARRSTCRPSRRRISRSTEASDWYSVGAMLYEALTGRRPFEGDAEQVMTRKQTESPLDPRQLAPTAPPISSRLCMQLLAAGAARAAERARRSSSSSARRRRRSTRDIGAHRDAGDVRRPRPRARRAAPRARRCAARAASRCSCAASRASARATLIRTFLRGLGDAVFVLEGRCFEREQVPFKMLDGIVDMLTGAIVALPPPTIERARAARARLAGPAVPGDAARQAVRRARRAARRAGRSAGAAPPRLPRAARAARAARAHPAARDVRRRRALGRRRQRRVPRRARSTSREPGDARARRAPPRGLPRRRRAAAARRRAARGAAMSASSSSARCPTSDAIALVAQLAGDATRADRASSRRRRQPARADRDGARAASSRRRRAGSTISCARARRELSPEAQAMLAVSSDRGAAAAGRDRGARGRRRRRSRRGEPARRPSGSRRCAGSTAR